MTAYKCVVSNGGCAIDYCTGGYVNKIAYFAIMFYYCTGVYDSVFAYYSVGVDYSVVHYYSAFANFCSFCGMCGFCNKWCCKCTAGKLNFVGKFLTNGRGFDLPYSD